MIRNRDEQRSETATTNKLNNFQDYKKDPFSGEPGYMSSINKSLFRPRSSRWVSVSLKSQRQSPTTNPRYKGREDGEI